MITSATDAIVLRSLKTDFDRVAKAFDELKAVREEFALLRPGQGFIVGGGIPWPVEFTEPKIVRAAPVAGAARRNGRPEGGAEISRRAEAGPAR